MHPVRSNSHHRNKRSFTVNKRAQRRTSSASSRRYGNQTDTVDSVGRAVSSMSIQRPADELTMATNHASCSGTQKPITSVEQILLTTEDQFGIPIEEISLECVVCATVKLLIEFQGIYSDICVHVERTVCNSCVYDNTKYLVEDSMIYYGEVTCPEPNCNGKFDYHAIREIILFLGKDKALFEQYDQHVIRQHLEQMPDFIWCANACGSGQLHDYTGSSNPVVTCLKCQQTTCFKHRIVWHTDMSCEQYDILKSQPSENCATSKWLELFTKQCPQCQWHIQKSEGCDHMTCRHCKHEFCWECFVDYKRIADSGSSQHQPVCSHYQVKPSHHHSKDTSAPSGVSSCPIF